ncbi:MAG: hypothetical protein V3T05_13645, partial [Myxococcota bacterium]
YPESGKLEGPLKLELERIVSAVNATPGSRLRIEVHASAEGGRFQAQVRSARIATMLKSAFAAAGVAESSIEIAARGASQPLMVGASRRARSTNRRVILEIFPPKDGAKAGWKDGKIGEAQPAHVRIAGVEMELDDVGGFAGKVVVEHDATLVVDIATGDRRSAIYNVPTFEGRPLAGSVAAAVMPRAFRPAADDAAMGSLPSALMAPPATEAVVPVATPSDRPTFNESVTGGGVDAIAGWSGRMPPASLKEPSGPARFVEPSGPTRFVEPSGPARFVEPSGPARFVEPSGPARFVEPSGPARFVESPGPSRDGLLDPWEGSQDGKAVAASTPVTVPIADAPPTKAADLYVWLPPDGAELGGERLTIRGRTDGKNVVAVNGKPVAIDETGRFVHTVVLPAGEATVEVTARDEDGNVARVLRTYRVPNVEWFLLAFGDGVAGLGDKLDGMNDDTTLDFDNELYLHGRAVAYLKGRVRGSSLFASNPFETLRLTAHVDSGKQREADLLRQLIDPDKYYPVYGDAAEEKQDVSTRSKVYVLLEADESKLTVGNFRASLDGLELFRYHRTYFGAAVNLDHAFVEGNPTEVNAFVASGESGVRHRQLTFQGTGGSMYFLKDGDLLEGSERVELVVRDAVTGSRLVALPQARNVDYTIDYRDGRVVFSKPVPSTVLNGWRLNQNPISVATLEGHPVFVEVEYDYNSSTFDDDDDGERAFAVQVRQTLFDRLTIGGGYVDEDKTAAGGSHYKLLGAEARIRLFQNTRIDFEIAYSEAEDADHLISVDGGVTFGRLGSPVPFRAGETGGRITQQAKGWAAKVSVAGDIGEMTGAIKTLPPEPKPKPRKQADDAKPDDGAAAKKPPAPRGFIPYALYFQHQDRGFYSGTSILEQGQTKGGGQIRALITDQDTLRLRHDAVWSLVFVGGDERRLNRQMTTFGYERKGDGWKAGAEYGHTYWDDAQKIVNMDNLSGFGEVQLTPRLVGIVEQEFVLVPDRSVVFDTGDRFVTRLSVRYKLSDRLWLTATESLRWSGSNSTQIALKTKLSDDISLYASERLTAGDGRPRSTTVVGGESTAIPGSRSYAEYQLDSLASGRSGRAVLGMDNRWVVAEGLQLNLSYERAQLVGERRVGTGMTGYAVADPAVTGNGSGPLAREQQFTASGYSSGGVFPAGVASRDAFAIGLEYLRSKTLKVGMRFEIRYDRGDEELGAFDRLVFSGKAGGDWRWDRNLVLLARARGASVHNLDFRDVVGEELGFSEAQYLDVSVGLAYRPIHSDRFEGLIKWTRRYERRPTGTDLTQF